MRICRPTFFGGKVIKDDDTYLLEDHDFLPNLTLSKTTLKPGKATKGHKHPSPDIDEVYFFIGGKGVIEIDGEPFTVRKYSIVQIKGHEHHRVFNTSKVPLVFISVFNRYKRE